MKLFTIKNKDAMETLIRISIWVLKPVIKALLIMAVLNWICDGVFTLEDIGLFQSLSLVILVDLLSNGLTPKIKLLEKAHSSLCRHIEKKYKDQV